MWDVFFFFLVAEWLRCQCISTLLPSFCFQNWKPLGATNKVKVITNNFSYHILTLSVYFVLVHFFSKMFHGPRRLNWCLCNRIWDWHGIRVNTFGRAPTFRRLLKSKWSFMPPERKERPLPSPPSLKGSKKTPDEKRLRAERDKIL